MLRSSLLALLLVSTSVCAKYTVPDMEGWCDLEVSSMKVTQQQADMVTTLAKVAGINTPTLRIIDSGYMTAYACPDDVGIAVSKQLINFTKDNPEMLAGVIAHEIGHLLQRKYEIEFSEIQKPEFHADYLSKIITTRAGYGECALAHFFKKRIEMFGLIEDTISHPDDQRRIEALNCNL